MKRFMAVALCAWSVAEAQTTLRGVAYDSLHGRTLASAFVQVRGTASSAISDSLGRFSLSNVPKGRQRLVMQHDILDALGLGAVAANVVVSGDADSIVIAIPSFQTLWRAACGMTASMSDSGFIFGTVSRGGKPFPFAQVSATASANTAKPGSPSIPIQIDADSTGNYAICGLPTNLPLRIRATTGSTQSLWIDVAPLAPDRIARRDLPIVTSSAMQLELPPSVVFTGSVRLDSSDLAIADVEVLLTDLGLTATTNARGEFRIPGVSPGEHPVRLRKVGYAMFEQRVAFEPGANADKKFVLVRVTTLDSVRVIGRNAPVDEALRLFEENRKIGLGKFLTRADLEKLKDRRMLNLFAQMPGIKADGGSGGQGWLLSTRANRSIDPGGAATCTPPTKQDHAESVYRAPARGAQPQLPPCTNYCYPRVFLDGVDISQGEIPNINRFAPGDFEAIEYYSGAAQIPPEYNRLNKAYCGLVVLHSRRGPKR
jgi:hypothetical protein